jgi:hypothetical protein
VAILEVLSDAGGPATAATRAARADQLAATVSTLGEPPG